MNSNLDLVTSLLEFHFDRIQAGHMVIYLIWTVLFVSISGIYLAQGLQGLHGCLSRLYDSQHWPIVW